MKLADELKKQVEKAETKDEKKSLIENAGMLLNDDELDPGVKKRWWKVRGLPLCGKAAAGYGWMKNPKSAMISCNDGFRPVSFLLEAMDKDAE